MARIALTSAAGLALMMASSALAAQDTAPETIDVAEGDPAADDTPSPEDDMAAMAEMFGSMYKVDPLTSEQEARLPAARKIIARIIPEGTMAELGKEMFNGLLGPIVDNPALGGGASAALAKSIGVQGYSISVEEADAKQLASLFDPAWEERQAREKALVPDMMAEVMGIMEPGMRKAMAELYAIHFTGAELATLDAFFATETGAKYARESFAMSTDPRIMATSMEALPALMASLGDIEQRMAASTADLPPPRSFADLTPAEKARVAEATGYSIEEIEANLQAPMVMETVTPPPPVAESE